MNTKTNIYKRFYRIPKWVKIATFFISWISLAMLVDLLLSKHSLAVTVIAIVFARDLASYWSTVMHEYAVHRRLWAFGKNKFSTWEEFTVWMAEVDPSDLDRVAGMKDEEWRVEDVKKSDQAELAREQALQVIEAIKNAKLASSSSGKN